MIFRENRLRPSSGNRQLGRTLEPPASSLTCDEHWMHEALRLARHAGAGQEVPVGAVVVHQGQVIGQGRNRSITDIDPSAHAEVVALRAAAKHLSNYRLLDATLFVTLEPCVMCVGAMLHARIKRLVFGAHDPKTGAAGSVFDLLVDSRHNHAVEVRGGVLEAECSQLLRDFFKDRRDR